jgi:hypothetical protein
MWEAVVLLAPIATWLEIFGIALAVVVPDIGTIASAAPSALTAPIVFRKFI